MPKSSIKDSQKLKKVWKKTQNICAHCGKKASGGNRTVDHFIPRSIGGGSDIRNLMPLCENCNRAKRSELVEPSEYYAFAPAEAINACTEYLSDWKHMRTNMNGEIFIMRRYGAQ